MRKRKLFNKGNVVLFVDSTSIKVSPNVNKNQDSQKRSIGRSKKKDNNEVKFMLYRFMSSSFSFIFCQLLRYPEGKKLIESIYHKNNSYLLMDIAYEDDKTVALAKARSFHAVVPPKKNRKSTWLYDKQLYKQRNNI